MKKNLVGMVYSYLVCFVCVCVLISFVISGLYGIFKIVSPETTLSKRERNKIATVERYKKSFWRSRKSSEGKGGSVLSDKEIKIKWEEEKKAVLIDEKQEGIASIINMFITLIVCTPVYFIHTRLAKKFGEKEV